MPSGIGFVHEQFSEARAAVGNRGSYDSGSVGEGYGLSGTLHNLFPSQRTVCLPNRAANARHPLECVMRLLKV